MQEKFRVSERESKRWFERQIAEGLAEIDHPEIFEEFEKKETEKPLRRGDFEWLTHTFFKENVTSVVPLLVQENTDLSELIDALQLTNQQLGLMGSNYVIREEKGKKVLYTVTEDNPDGYRSWDIQPSEILALAFVREHVGVDTTRKIKGCEVPHRFYLKNEGRYLAANDYGMKVWNEEEGRLVEGDITNLSPFIQAASTHFRQIGENLKELGHQSYEKTKSQLEQVAVEQNGGQDIDWEQRNAIERVSWEKASEMAVTSLTSNPKNLELVMDAVPYRKVRDHLHFHFDDIALKYGFISDSPVRDYEEFEQNRGYIKDLIRFPNGDDRHAGSDLNYIYSDYYRRPVIIRPNFDENPLVSEALGGVKEILARRVVDSDPQIKEAFDRHRCVRGGNSPYYYADSEILDFIRSVGPEKAQAILESDDRNVSEQMIGWQWLSAMHMDVSKMTPDQVKKQLLEADKLSRSGLWDYFQTRDAEKAGKAEVAENYDYYRRKQGDLKWASEKTPGELRHLFYEGKRMYWLAQQVYYSNPQRQEEDRFYHNDSYVRWDRYDLSAADVPQERLQENLKTNNNLIVALMNAEDTAEDYYGRRHSKAENPQATLFLIIQALEKGNDLRGVALARDKQRYLKGLIDGMGENDLEFAIADWPDKWKEAVSMEEIQLYYEYANQYVFADVDGLTKYAKWRSSPEGKAFDKEFSEAPTKKSELDFRICLGSQTDEIIEWYRSGSEYAGGEVMREYLLRFNATRDAEGRVANWHDVLFWIPNINKLEKGDIRSVLASIETMDENNEFIALLPRYSKDRDPFKDQGAIQSVRELRKRVLAIESNIDLSSMPPELLDITAAPGFNLSALERMRRRADFADLIEGKLDETQPFKPHRRLFTSRSLTEALGEGLGSREKRIRGTALDPKGFYHELKGLVKGRTVGERNMTVSDLLSSVPIDLEESVTELLVKQKVDVGQIVEAQIHNKSDPDGWVCGNYTDCCMPFGDRNNDDYMFNKATQYFTIKMGGRIVAQSVVVDSVDRRTREDVVILDNIEVANNYKKLTPLLSRVYQTFWTEYTSKPVKVGTGYSDLIPSGGRLEQNYYDSKNSLYYSDARGSQIYDMPKVTGVESLDNILTYANLTERDSRQIAEMESRCYPEGMAQGESYVRELLEKQREMEVPGAASSFIVRQGSEPAGYMLVLPEESEIKPGERVAHIYDMAILPEYRGSMVFKRMLDRMFDVATSYGVSIEAEARASTSYAILMNERVRRMFERKGFFLVHNEKLPQYLGGEDFYLVRFENRGITQETEE